MTKRIAAFLLASLALSIAPPARAQFSESYNFLKAVREADGEKVTAVIGKAGSGAVMINTRDSNTGEMAVHIVTARRDLTWLNFLLAKGAAINAKDRRGNTPLMLATQLSWSEGISLLIERHADVNLANSSGETPLIRAVLNRDLAIARLLLQGGADPAKHDTAAGLSARDYAKRDARAGLILKAMDDARPRSTGSVGPH